MDVFWARTFKGQMNQNQEIDSFISWQMVTFIKVDFLASLSKKKGIF